MENVKLNFVILCENAFIAQGTNLLNVIGIFDRIEVRKFPAVHPKLVIVTNISGNPGEYDQLIVIKDKTTNEKVAELQRKLKIHQPKQKAQFIGNFFNVVFSNTGEYSVEIYINNKKQSIETIFFVG